MTKSLFLRVLCLLTAALAVRDAAAASPRQHILMDAGWRFRRGEPAGTPHPAGGAIGGWRWRTAANGEAITAAQDTSGADWHDMTAGQDAFGGRKGFVLFQTTLPAVTAPANRRLHFESADDNATVSLNGKRLAAHKGWDDPFDVPLDAAWNAGGPNIVTVLVENTAGGGGLAGPVTLQAGAETTPGAAKADYPDRAWRTVHLPHDFVIEGTFDPRGNAGHGALPTDVGWYRKTFPLPASDRGRTLWLDFDGVYRNSQVWLNGHLLGRHACGYSPFRVDISRAANFGGPNTLAVRADARAQEGWWYEGGGIYRHVWLNVTDPVHVAPWGTLVTSQLPEPAPGRPATAATVAVKTTVSNDSGRAAACTLRSRIVDETGRVVGDAATPVSVAPGASRDFAQSVVVPTPRLWSPEFPHLYHVTTTIQRGHRTVDAYDTPFGIRTIRFDPNLGFFLNGVSVKIKGTCNHQDFAGVGVGVPDSLLAWRVRKLKTLGSNAYRTSHNAPAAELLDVCDREGMLVMDENRHLGNTEGGKAAPGTPASDLGDLKAMILRDRNHPSVILWSMCNEEPLQSTPDGARIFTAMRDAVLKLDPTRPVSCAMNGGQGQGISLVEDLVGFNYGPGAYDGYHRDHPAQPLYGSETASAVGARGVYATEKFSAGGKEYSGDQTKSFVNAYDVNAPPWAQTAEDAWRPLAERPFMAGGFVWTGFDYKGEPTPFDWPDINSNFGVLDLCGFPKDSAWYYRAWWGGRPVTHILPHWNWAGKEGQPVDVWAFSNAARVALSLNGRTLGVKDVPRFGHVQWSVPYAPGALEARGLDANGKVVSVGKVETTGAPAGLRLTTDRTRLTADGEDLIPVAVEVIDAQGRVVPTADNPVSFRIAGAGRIAGVGNGDPTSHEPDQAPRRRAFNGQCLVIVGAGDKKGDAQLTAAAPGLAPAGLRFSVR